MTVPVDTASLVLAGLLGMVVGGNNLSACCGTIIGSGMVRRRSGILLAVAGYMTGLVIECTKLFRGTEVVLPAHTSTGALASLLASLLVFPGGEFFKVALALSRGPIGAIVDLTAS